MLCCSKRAAHVVSPVPRMPLGTTVTSQAGSNIEKFSRAMVSNKLSELETFLSDFNDSSDPSLNDFLNEKISYACDDYYPFDAISICATINDYTIGSVRQAQQLLLSKGACSESFPKSLVLRRLYLSLGVPLEVLMTIEVAYKELPAVEDGGDDGCALKQQLITLVHDRLEFLKTTANSLIPQQVNKQPKELKKDFGLAISTPTFMVHFEGCQTQLKTVLDELKPGVFFNDTIKSDGLGKLQVALDTFSRKIMWVLDDMLLKFHEGNYINNKGLCDAMLVFYPQLQLLGPVDHQTQHVPHSAFVFNRFILCEPQQAITFFTVLNELFSSKYMKDIPIKDAFPLLTLSEATDRPPILDLFFDLSTPLKEGGVLFQPSDSCCPALNKMYDNKAQRWEDSVEDT